MTWYRGGVGQWSWIFHRVSGLGVLVFLCLHILDTALVVLGPEHYNSIIRLYRHPAFRLMEVGLFAAVLYHALNGIRITLIDFWPRLALFHEAFFAIQMSLFTLTMIPVTWFMVRPIFL